MSSRRIPADALERIEAWEKASMASSDRKIASLRARQAEAKARARMHWREICFRLGHPLTTFQIWRRHGMKPHLQTHLLPLGGPPPRMS